MTEFRPGRFEILPPVIKNLLIINILIFLVQWTLKKQGSQISPEDYFALHTWQSTFFQPWQFITHLFMHGSWGHLIGNMLALWMFGAVLENLWGSKRFITFYIACGLGAAFCHMVVLYFQTRGMMVEYYQLGDRLEDNIRFMREYGVRPGELPEQIVSSRLREATLGASGAVMGCLAAFGYLFPNSYLLVIPIPFPIKAKWFVLLYIGYELFSTIQNSAGDNVAHIAHLGGALVGFLLVYFWNKNNRRRFY